MPCSDEDIRGEILKQIAGARSIAPREIALALTTENDDWRSLLPRIRSMAASLSSEGLLDCIRKRKKVPFEGLRGVYRLAAPGNYE